MPLADRDRKETIPQQTACRSVIQAKVQVP